MSTITLGFGRLAAAACVLLSAAAASAADVRLQGAGATFPNPLYQRWVTEYQKAHPGVRIDYQSIGSGGGIKGIAEKTVDFAGSDAPLSRKELENMGGAAAVIQIPSCAGSVVPAYNVPGVTGALNFTGEVIADIYLGRISKWNDAKLSAINPGVSLPAIAITPAWRTDGSGTTFVFTNYVCTQSAEFRALIGAGKQVKWPLGQGGKGNEGVAAIVQQTPGAFGYIELNYAAATSIAFGAVRNPAGNFVKATPESVSAAGEGAAGGMSGPVLAADLWNQQGEAAYPISSFTYLIIYSDLRNLKNRDQARALVEFLWWATHEGQEFAGAMDYAPLSEGVRAKVEAALRAATFKGEVVLSAGR